MTTEYTIPKEVQEKHLALAEKRIDTKIASVREMGYRKDAIAFTRGQLEQLESTIYDVLYANPRDAFRWLPINSSASPGATSYSYRMVSKLGAAKVVADGAVDRPIVDVDLTKHERNIYEVGAAYTYTVGEQESGQILDFDYVMDKARLCAQTIALAHNEYALLGGSGVTGGLSTITGFLNNATVVSNIPSLTDTSWATAPVGTDQYATIRDMITDVTAGSSGIHTCTDVVLSTYVWNTISGTLVGDGSTWGSSQTVLAALRQNYPGITFSMSPSCTARGANGVDRCVAFERGAANCEYVAAVLYDESTPDKSGFRYSVQARGKMAGTIIRYPLSMVYGDITIA
jgi:hypothetical protein